MELLTFFLLQTILVVVLAALTFAFFNYFRKLEEDSLPDNELPFISVIVPARNEEGKIGRCLESLAKQDYPNYEVVAVDDRSVDKTGEIIKDIAARYPHVKYVRGTDPPPGWLGKCNALKNAVQHTSGKWYLFTDADTCHTPESLRYAMSYSIRNKAELISFMPVQELGSFWEKTVMPVFFFYFIWCYDINTITNTLTNVHTLMVSTSWFAVMFTMLSADTKVCTTKFSMT